MTTNKPTKNTVKATVTSNGKTIEAENLEALVMKLWAAGYNEVNMTFKKAPTVTELVVELL